MDEAKTENLEAVMQIGQRIFKINTPLLISEFMFR